MAFHEKSVRPRRFKVEGWFLRSLAASHHERVEVCPSAVLYAESTDDARAQFAARYRIPPHIVDGVTQGDLRTGRVRRPPIPLLVLRAEEVRG